MQIMRGVRNSKVRQQRLRSVVQKSLGVSAQKDRRLLWGRRKGGIVGTLVIGTTKRLAVGMIKTGTDSRVLYCRKNNMANSKRKYITIAELEAYADIDVTDNDEGAEKISVAEEIIDHYVKSVLPHVQSEFSGVATDGSTTTLVDTSSDNSLSLGDDYYTYCEIEIIGGTNKGEVRTIASSVKDTKTLTVDTAFSAAIDSTSVYLIRQIGKFPRACDMKVISDKYYKFIPPNVRRAVVAQMEYMIEKGTEFFMDGVNKTAESIGSYSSTNAKVDLIVAPKVRTLLREFVKRTGKILV